MRPRKGKPLVEIAQEVGVLGFLSLFFLQNLLILSLSPATSRPFTLPPSLPLPPLSHSSLSFFYPLFLFFPSLMCEKNVSSFFYAVDLDRGSQRVHCYSLEPNTSLLGVWRAGWPVPCRKFSSLPVPYPLQVSRASPSQSHCPPETIKNVSAHFQMPSGEKS